MRLVVVRFAGRCALGLLLHSGVSAAQPGRDSAGVEIVEHDAPPAAARPVFQLASRARVSIGRSPEDFYGVRAGLRLSDGTIVVADGGSHELRFFSPAGTRIATIGRRGQGPTDFTQFTGLRRILGDTIVVLDARNARVSVLDSRGRMLETISIEATPTDWSFPVFGVFRDGRMLISGPAGTAHFSGVPRRDYRGLVLLSSEGELLGRVGSFPGDERISVTIPQPGGVIVMPRYSPLFGRRSSVAVDADHFWFADGSSYEVAFYEPTGARLRVIRVRQPNLPVTPADIEAARRSRISSAYKETLIAAAPTKMPAISRLEIDRTGRLWVEEYRHPEAPHARWSVFERSGGRIGFVLVLRDRRILEWGADYALTVREDSDGVEFVELLDLTPVPPAPRR